MTDLFDASVARALPLAAQEATDRVGSDRRPLALVEVEFRQPARFSRLAAAGATAGQVVAAVIEGLAATPADITALDDDADRCWVVFAPSGLRLARVGGLTASDFNHALAGHDAAAFQRIAA